MGAWQEIVDFTFTANETSRTFSGLSITKDDFIKVITTIEANTASAIDYRLLANSSTNTDYHYQLLQGSGTSAGASRDNVNRFQRSGVNKVGYNCAYLKLSENDRLNIFSNYTFEIDSDVTTTFSYNTSSGATFTSGITSLTLQAAATDAIGTDSRIQIYKLAAEKVADITVGSNTTQVDISNLSIDKDSEYLLVSDVINPQVDGSFMELFVNNSTTSTNYYFQNIRGIGSTASAFRINNARYSYVYESSSRTVTHSHIKLSNIGAYTSQNYAMLYVGNSDVELQNGFVSSTSEAITSITQLNIRAAITNAIGSGSRFTLYKLYE